MANLDWEIIGTDPETGHVYFAMLQGIGTVGGGNIQLRFRVNDKFTPPPNREIEIAPGGNAWARYLTEEEARHLAQELFDQKDGLEAMNNEELMTALGRSLEENRRN